MSLDSIYDILILMEVKAVHPLLMPSNLHKILILVLLVSIVAGVATGHALAQKSGGAAPRTVSTDNKPAAAAQQDTKTFRDFAEGTIKPIPTAKSSEYTEGTHILDRTGAYPVTLTSSVVDLSKYEGKKVKVYGETQKALKASWLMDVGKVEAE